MKIVIVGGVAAGAGAATRARRLMEDATIVLFERGDFVSYANCALPYYVGGEIAGEEKLTVASPEFLKKRFLIDVRVRSEVISIDRAAHTVNVRTDSGEYTETYDKLVIATGAAAVTFGIECEGVFKLKDVPDALKLEKYIALNEPESALVAGGGFIGIETAENLVRRGIKVTIAEYGDQIMANLDPEMAVIVQEEAQRNGVEIILGKGVKAMEKVPDGVEVAFTDGTKAACGVAVIAAGVRPESALAAAAGLKTTPRGNILTDEHMLTSDPDIYAAGDVISVWDAFGAETAVPLAGPANRQGRSVASNIAGYFDDNGKRVIGASAAKVFSLTAASVGKNEKQLRASGVKYLKAYAFPFSHASYYPGAKQLALKLLFDEKGVVLGAQGIGEENVVKQIDVISVVMQFGGTVADLARAELSYAPPYNSAKSPVNMLGFIAENIISGLAPTVYPDTVGDMMVIDVRNPAELKFGAIEGAINIPLDALRENLNMIPSGKKIAVSCAVGLRGYIGTRILRQHGFNAYNLSGGYRAYSIYKKAGLI